MPTSTYQAADLPGELADFAPLLMLDDGAQDPGVDDAYRLRLHDYWFAAIGAAGDLISTSSHFGLPGGHSLVEEMFGTRSDARLAGDQVTTLAGGQMGVGQLPAERSSARTDHLDALRPQTGLPAMAAPPLDPAGAGEVIDEEELAREQAKRERAAANQAAVDGIMTAQGDLRAGSLHAKLGKEFVEEVYATAIALLEAVPILGDAVELYQIVTGVNLSSMDPSARLTAEERLTKAFFFGLGALPFAEGLAAGGKFVSKTASRAVGAGGDLLRHGGRHLDDAAGGVGIVARQGDGVVSATRAARSQLDPSTMCFAADTPVQTARGLVPIGDVHPGAEVYAYDHAAAQWCVVRVLTRHDNNYTGTIVALDFNDSQIRATAGHPFWVLRGEELAARPRAAQLPAGEDEGHALNGRWVDSHELRAGDEVFCHDGRARRIARVALSTTAGERVCNLTLERLHTYAVGAAGALVHNRGWCDVLSDVSPKPADLVSKAKRMGYSPSQVHAHHIVQRAYDPKRALVKGTRDWHIKQSQGILKKFNISVLDDISDAAARAGRGEKLHNLTWAINGNGTHTNQTVAAVWRELTKAATRRQVLDTLSEFSRLFALGERVV